MSEAFFDSKYCSFDCMAFNKDKLQQDLWDIWSYNHSISKQELTRKIEKDMPGNIAPCLALKMLFVDLFKGSRISDENDEDGTAKTVFSNPPLIGCDFDAKDIFHKLLPFFDKDNKTYRSRIMNRQEKNNTWANDLVKCLNDNPDDFIKRIELSCNDFLLKSKYDAQLLKEYLLSRIQIFINHLDVLDDTNNPDLINERKSALKDLLSLNEFNISRIFAITVVLAALNWRDLGYKNFQLIMGGGRTDFLSESDILYLDYLNNKDEISDKTLASLEQAYKRLNKVGVLFEKEILLEHAETLLKLNNKAYAVQVFSEIEKIIEKYPTCGKAYYLLAFCYKEGIGCVKSNDLSLKNMNIAMELNDTKSMLFMVEDMYHRFLKSHDVFLKNSIENLCKKIISVDANKKSAAYGKSAYILGDIYAIIDGDIEQAITFYEFSAEAGYTLAIDRIKTYTRRKRSIYDEINQRQNKDSNSQHILIDGDDDTCIRIINNFDVSAWNAYSLSTAATIIPQISVFDFLRKYYEANSTKKEYPTHCIFAYFGEDENKNLNNALRLLDYLYNISIDLKVLDSNDNGSRKEKFVNSIDIYLSCEYEIASMLIDANLSDMGNGMYFRVHICDRNKDAARWLLTTCPIFIPCLKSGEKNPHIVTFGNSDFIYNFVREVSASTYMSNHKVTISSLGTNIEKIENKFKQNCMGIYTVELEDKIVPQFFECDLSHPIIQNVITGKIEPNSTEYIKSITASINTGNYYVVDIGSDVQNIVFARNLRSWLLRSDPEFKRLPFIAVRCKDEYNSYLAQRLTVGNCAHGDQWYNSYDLYCFDDVFPRNINNNYLETLSKNIHLSYYGENINNGLSDYYIHSYNKDSSQATAVGLIYRMFDNDIFFEDYHKYNKMDKTALTELAKKYDDKLARNKEDIDRLSAAEQTRWNCYMLTRGYLYATPRQVVSYMQERKSNSHKQELCKLHPYLCDWSDLSEKSGSNFSILKSQLPNLKSPRLSTNHSIRSTLSFFKEDMEEQKAVSDRTHNDKGAEK